MGVLLEGLNIPEGNPITINIYRDGTWVNAYTTEDGNAIEVPEPHGRLIDADKLKSYWEPDHSRYFDADYFIHTIDTAQTIIPASEEGET